MSSRELSPTAGRELLLHIGRHKSGTTAIQLFLQGNRDVLRNRGFLIPRSGWLGEGHHLLARPLQRAAVRDSGLSDPKTLSVYQDLFSELAAVDPELTVVLSSEAFQNCDAPLVQRGLDAFRVRVIVYLRNQIDYLASAYAQRVHATNYTGDLEQFYRDIFLRRSDYREFLAGWEQTFPGALTVRRYAPGSMVEDFIAAGLGLPADGWVLPEPDVNPSLNATILRFKRRLNGAPRADMPAPKPLYHALPRLNALFPAPRCGVPQALQDDLVARVRDGENAVALRYFGEQQLFDYAPRAYDPGEPLTDALFERIYAALLDLAGPGI